MAWHRTADKLFLESIVVCWRIYLSLLIANANTAMDIGTTAPIEWLGWVVGVKLI